MATKIKMQKGYPDSSSTLHKTYAEAMTAQSKINLSEAMISAGDADFMQFIDKNSSEVLEYIKYNCSKKKTVKKQPAKAGKKTASELAK